MAVTRMLKSRAKRRIRSGRETAKPAPRAKTEDPVARYREEAAMLDAVLDSASATLPHLRIPGRFGLWLARFPIEQIGNDHRVAEFESYLSEITWAIDAFVRAGRHLPEQTHASLTDVGLGPDAFAALLEDPRITTHPRPPRRNELVRFLGQVRERTSAAVAELDRQTERGYR